MVVAQEMEWLQSKMESETTGGSSTTSSSEGTSEGITELQDDQGNVTGYAVNSSLSSSASEAETQSWSRTVAYGLHQALRSIYEERYSSVHPLDKVMYDATVKLANQPPRSAVVKVPGQRSCRITVPEVPAAGIEDSDVSDFKQGIFEASEYVAPLASVEEELDLRHQKLIELAAPMTSVMKTRDFDSG